MVLQGKVISNFALLHFLGARRFAENVGELERNHAGEALGDFFVDISIYSSSCIVAAAAAIEALINELYLQDDSPLHQAIANFDEYFWGRTRPWWCFWKTRKVPGLEGKPALEKYRRALILLNKPPIPRNQPARENVELLIGLRNYLVHFKPLWDEQRRNDRLEQALTGRFATSPFMNAHADFVAKRCMSAGCARWAVNAVVEFVREFQQKSGLMPEKLNAFS